MKLYHEKSCYDKNLRILSNQAKEVFDNKYYIHLILLCSIENMR